MKDRDRIEKFTSSAIRGFLDAKIKRQQQAEAAEAVKARHGKDWHSKEYSPTLPVASYPKIPAVSNPPIVKGQQVQTPSVQKVQTPQSVQQVQTPPVQQVEPAPAPIESALIPAPAPAPVSAPAPAFVSATFSPTFLSQSTEPSSFQQFSQQPAVNIPPGPTSIPVSEISSLIPTSVP